ncbi:MAG: hypothetical protein KDI04_07415 [Halieaceae bacterium]|nr:hypothetical protein [Halieaceae bacterium]MCP5147255.1 hypothetical protein [Pseudomonadales bacterium]MCP5166741.1 hypothetical protein [Pseudomonadales bacterium]MCP5186696.1 hypothetical protein [Pseudomonadales bacterium]
MKTMDLKNTRSGAQLTLQLDEFELTSLVALVEQGVRQLGDREELGSLHAHMASIASEFCSLLGHLELLAADD